jgi:MFS transporter, DHA1 family, multidrug resistance protein
MQKTTNHIYLIIILAVLSSVAPMGIDTYLPSIPSIATDLEVSIDKIELSLSIFLIGFSIGQIFGGPLSDRLGRKKSSILGLLGFALFSFLIIFCNSLYELWVYRFLEAFFGGVVVVNATAAIRDRFHGQEAAKVFSLLGTIRALVPLMAPLIGSSIIHFYSWRAVFVFLTLYAVLVAFWVYKDLDESFTYSKQNIIESFKLVLKNTMAVRAMLVLSLSFSGFFIFIAKSSFIFIEYFKISTDLFPFFFGFNFILIIIMTRVNILLLKKYSIIDLIKTAILIQIVSGILFIINYHHISIFTTMLVMGVYMSMIAFIFGNGLTLALEYFPKNAGVASSVAGVLQFGLGALISSFALSFHNDTFLPIALSITFISIVSFFIIWVYR